MTHYSCLGKAVGALLTPDQNKGEGMRKKAYLAKAAKRFLERTNCISPIHAVELGKRTLEEWVDVLREEFEREQQRKLELRKTRTAKRLAN